MRASRFLVAVLAVSVTLAVMGFAGSASAAVHRYAVIMGDNRGDTGDVELRYAESDAQRVYDVLKDLGGFEPTDMVLLRGEDAPRAQATLIAINERIRAVIASGADALLFVYYSGHAGADALHMAGSRFDLDPLEQLVRGSAATFRILAVDACRSGTLTRAKGGRPAPPFAIDIDEHLSEQGVVLLTSSAANEDAQESDALQGSFFTHAFVSALLGAGDADGDGRVTLDEAYRYAFDATLRATSATWAGAQHPTFRYDLRGVGELPLTSLAAPGRGRATLVFPPNRMYLVMAEGENGTVVGEVGDTSRGRRMSLRPGRYFVRGRATDRLLEGMVDAPDGASVDVGDDRLRSVEYARLVRKGSGVRTVVQGVEAGGFWQTPLKDADDLCWGAFAGWQVHMAVVNVGARLAACHASFTNDYLRASSNAYGGELRVTHTWDAPVVGIDLGLALGGWLLTQHFTTAGVAPTRETPAASLALVLGLHVDLGAGFAAFVDAALQSLVYAQHVESTNTTSLGPYVSVRQALGLSKEW